MKALNDHIRESLLDDEEELIGNSIKDSQDPLNVLASICKDKYNEDKILKKFDEGLFDDFLRDVISIDMNDIKGLGVTWRVVNYSNFVSISLITERFSTLFSIRYVRTSNKIILSLYKPSGRTGNNFNVLVCTNYFDKYRSTLIKLGKLGFKKSTTFPNLGNSSTVEYEKKL